MLKLCLSSIPPVAALNMASCCTKISIQARYRLEQNCILVIINHLLYIQTIFLWYKVTNTAFLHYSVILNAIVTRRLSLDALATFSWSKYRCCIFRFIYLALEVSWNSIHYCLLIISISKFVQQNMLILDIVRKLINEFQKEAIQSGFNAWASPVKKVDFSK